MIYGIYVIDFIKPEQGFEYIESYKNNEAIIPTVLFLDINMPTMSGWEFLEKFDKLDEKVKEQFSVYITSSSIDDRDIEMAKANRYIKRYIVKPANVAVIKKLYNEIAEINL